MCVLVACKKDGNDSSFDESKLTGKDWKSTSTGTPWIILRFNADKGGNMKSITNIVTENYQTFEFNWSRKGSDSVVVDFTIQGTSTFRVYSVNDANLVMNNWILGGASDTSSVIFYAN